MWKKTLTTTAMITAALLVTGCSDTFKEQIGLGKRSPDEFKVVSRAPLSLPPDYNLQPPRPGALRPQEGSARGQARRAVFNLDGSAGPAREDSLNDGDRTQGEVALLQQAGADQAPEDIRLLVDRETRQSNAESQQLVDTLIFWKEQPSPATLVDPVKESQRLQENAALGTRGQGDTPTITREREAPLEGMLDGIF